MFAYKEVLERDPFSLAKEEKTSFLTERILELTAYHQSRCLPYKNMMRTVGFDEGTVRSYEQIPFIPVRIFKEMELRSIAEENIFKTITSSGTTGQKKSKIFLDQETATEQHKTLVRVVSDFTKSQRMPMIIIDCPGVLKNPAMFSARGSAIMGFSIFGRQRIYALNDDMELEFDRLQHFLAEHEGERIFLFGFTFMIWQHFYQALRSRKEKLNLSNAVLIHGGGWKKMIQDAVSPEEFKQGLKEVCDLPEVYNFYGMAEQSGCIYMECSQGHFHAASYFDVLIRRPQDFSIAPIGERGIIQVVSVLPKSYPGHSLLTEDEGMLMGEDDCLCGRKGKYFKVFGRLKNAEIRGCSDTYAAGL